MKSAKIRKTLSVNENNFHLLRKYFRELAKNPSRTLDNILRGTLIFCTAAIVSGCVTPFRTELPSYSPVERQQTADMVRALWRNAHLDPANVPKRLLSHDEAVNVVLRSGGRTRARVWANAGNQLAALKAALQQAKAQLKAKASTVDTVELAFTRNYRLPYENNRGLFLVHSWRPSRTPGQVADIVIWLHQHGGYGPLVDGKVVRVEYHLGPYFEDEEVIKTNKDETFRYEVSAYGPMLCLARAYIDGEDEPIELERYIDFEDAP